VSTYATSESALLTAVRASEGGATYTEVNSSRGDFSVLNGTGVTRAAVLMQAGASEFGDNLGQGRGTHGKRQQRHRIAIIVFQARRQDDDGYTYVALKEAADMLIAYLDTVPRLNGAPVKRAEVIELSDVRRQRDRAWIFQTVLVEILTETAPVLVEGPH
jgi:hypothetical protein